MPRSNRPRGRRGGDGEEDLDLTRALIAFKHTESKRDGLWNVQPLSASNATKVYRCPGCQQTIPPGVAHIVAWPADGRGDLTDRRHWHSGCWKARDRRYPSGR